MFQYTVVFLDERERILEVFGQPLMEYQIKRVVREGRLERIATDEFQVIVKVFTRTERIDNLEAVFGKVENVDIRPQLRKFRTVSTRTRTHFQDF